MMHRTIAETNTLDQARWIHAFCVILVGTFVANLGIGIQNIFGIDQQLITTSSKLIIIIYFITCLPSMLRTDILPLFWLILAIVSIVILQMSVFPSLNPWFVPTLKEFIVLCLPMIICIYMIDDLMALDCALVKVSSIISFCTLIAVIAFGGRLFGSYEMGLSQSMIIPTNTLINYSFKARKASKRFFSILLVFSDVFTIAVFGSRGSLVAVALYFCYSILVRYHLTRKDLLKSLALTIIIMALALFYQDIIELLYTTLNNLGFSSRTMSMLANSNATYDSGRSRLWEIVWNDYKKDPLLIRGICSEYPLIGIYSHSLILTALHNLGSFIGSIILVLIALQIIGSLNPFAVDRSNVEQILLSSFFPVILWTGSFWISSGFWSWLTLYIKQHGLGAVKK